MERLVLGPGLVARELCDVCRVAVDGGGRDVLAEAWGMQVGCAARVNQDGVDKRVPVDQATTKVI